MDTYRVINAARKHLGKGVMDSSARLCLTDAVRLYDAGDLYNATLRAQKSIAYSVGIFHADYVAAGKCISNLARALNA